MHYFFRSILLICLLVGAVNFTKAQTVNVELSNNKVVVGGQTCFLHLVKEKQTLFSISRAYGVDLAVILQVNRKTEATVNVGEVLRIPVVDSETALSPVLVKKEDDKFFYHIVKKGDTLFSLYKKYAVDMALIKASNPDMGDSLRLGTIIKVPKIIKKPQLNTVPKHDKNYYYYVIKQGDTESSISRQFFMNLRKFKKLNPKLKSTALKIGDWVRIPRYLVPLEYFVEKEVQKDTIVKKYQVVDTVVTNVDLKPISQNKIRIALFLPLYLDANDSINRSISYKDTIEIVTERNPRILYSKSHDFIRFYQGVLLAVDSLQKEGLSVDLHVFDTEKNPERVQRIIAGLQYTDLDFMIGPVYQNTFSIVADFAQRRRIPIISPLSLKNSELTTNPFVIQMNTSIQSICGKISDYVCFDLDTRNLVVVHPDRYEHLNEFQLVTDIERNMFEKGKYWENGDMTYKKISFDEYGLFGIERMLSDTCENVILVPSTKQPYVENIISNLNVLSQRFDIRLIGFPVWQRFNSLDAELFYNLNLSVITPYNIDYKEAKVDLFVSDFREKFTCEPNDFSFRAFDLCRYFSKAVSRYGHSFPDHLNELKLDLLQSNYHFKRVNAFGGLENQGVQVVNYSRDFKIRHSIPKSQNTFNESE
ncbi:LysM peptidoglycan-binding domain-containing protein [Labilibaculum sp. K2S]|uniref:LysM peptidoglycan-binding domain-containing protein n=1 Tax=Labilibaculum sp. K2S TaxID=3056386 RepID=UPI0025A332B3|nr:LysM peptidoglycan-binding domain-containing protein [Labilibaculum sp. K2S]MDM8161806.1 LysM peptidoglycan-binding domain-containing protein [Labilibaculum sp. K2S]